MSVACRNSITLRGLLLMFVLLGRAKAFRSLFGAREFFGSPSLNKAVNSWRPVSTAGFVATEMMQSSISLGSESVHPFSFDDDTWETYASVVQDVMNSPPVVRQKGKIQSEEELQQANDYILSRTFQLSVPSPLTNLDSFQEEMTKRKDTFNMHYNMSNAQYDYISRCLLYLGDACAKNRNAKPAAIAWQKIKEAGLIPRENSISTYMYVLGIEETFGELLADVASFHDLYFSPNEKTITLRVKNLIAMGDVSKAEEIIDSLPDKGEGQEWKKLRTLLPVLEHHCHAGDANSILRLFRDMRQSPGVILDSETYALIIGSLARRGHFYILGSAIDNANEAGFNSTHGPKLFDQIATEMADDILELTESTVKEITDAFLEGFSIPREENTESSTIPLLIDAKTPADPLSIGKVEVDATTALCNATGARLRLFALDENQRNHVHQTLLEMARLSYRDFTKKQRREEEEEGENFGFEEISRFSEWLDTREGDPFTAIIDGPNVAYFGFSQLHNSQLKLVVEKLENMGESPLVIMPHKYTKRSFRLTHNNKLQLLTDREYGVLEGFRERGMLYTVSPRCLDDYYWMLASVSNQTTAKHRTDLKVSTGDDQGRFPGLRPMLITNDQMRDHKLDLLEPREFRRWCSCHIVNYNISHFEQDEWGERNVTFSPADFFSREIQGNDHPSGSGKVWHFPVAEWEGLSRFCLWIAR